MKVSEIRRKIIRMEVESVGHALASQDVIACTFFTPREEEPRVVFRQRTLFVFGRVKQLPFFFDKKTLVS